MKKSMIALAVAAATTAPVMVQAAAPEVSGFVDIIYSLVDDTADTGVVNTNESRFSADGEIDFKGNLAEDVSVQVDLDINTGGGDSTDIEQAFFTLKATDQISVMAGAFNNPIGWEAEDAPNMYQTTHSIAYGLLDSQTSLRGNNVIGVGVAGSADMISITAALLNDTQDTPEENSLAVAIGLTPVEGMELELGFLTQDNDSGVCTFFNSPADNDCGLGTIINANGSFAIESGLTVAAEIMLASEIIDYSMMAMVNMAIPETPLSVTARGELLAIDGGNDDTLALTFAGLYTYNDALGFVAEMKYIDGDFNDGDIQIALEAIASF